MKKIGITTDELIHQLASDPEYKKMRAKQDAELASRAAVYRAEQAQLLADLAAAGWEVESVWDLVNTAQPYPTALPVLLRHLVRPYSDRIREGIARALAVPDAASAWPMLLAEYLAAPADAGVKDGLAAALSATSSDDVIGELSSAARDTSNGSSRLLLLRGLRRSRSPLALGTLGDLRDDPDLTKEIASWRNTKQK